MSWRRKIGWSWGAIGLSVLLSMPAGAQDALDVFSDTDLPSLLDEEGDEPAAPELPEPADEELPPAEDDEAAGEAADEPPGPPQIDPEALDNRAPNSRFSSPREPSSGPSPGSRPATDPPPSRFSPRSGGEAARAAAPAPGPNAQDAALDETDAEILPQETIQERYPNGRVKIERGVSQDDTENYVNHGPWRMWDDAGNLIAEGTYRFGKRHGKWLRWYDAEEAELFQLPPYNLFTGPFQSQAFFRDGVLEGHWVVMDSADNKVSDWAFQDGRRHGESSWYYHTGKPMRVIQYRNGQIHGELLEWDVNGKPVTRVEYQDGRRLERMTETYEDGQKKVEGMVLQARLVMKQPDDWWEATLATYARQGKDQKHGEWTAWYPSGVNKFAGTYKFDRPDGEFQWWHENGQKSLHAAYVDGRKQGIWTWWHPNGQKAIQGTYVADSPSERWVWWHDSGKVAQRVDFSAAAASSPTAIYPSFGESIPLRQPQN